MHRALFTFALLLLATLPAQAKDINAASCSYNDVEKAVRKAGDGDRVIIPACEQTNWTRQLEATKCITITGTGDPFGDGPHTILGDDVAKDGTPSSTLMRITCRAAGRLRITGMEIVGVAPDRSWFKGHVAIGGTMTGFRADHLKISLTTAGIVLNGCVFGVVDHIRTSGVHRNAVVVHHQGCGDRSNGDYNWSQPPDLSSANFLVIEDSIFTDPAADSAPAVDMFGGSRVIFRHNETAEAGGHGTESTQRERGMRVFITYGNKFTATKPNEAAAVGFRSGTGLVYSNEFNSVGAFYYTNNPVNLRNFRSADSYAIWGACAATGNYDQNEATIYVSGTHDGLDGAVNVLTDTTKDFTTACGGVACSGVNGFSILNTTKHWGSEITGVTPATVTNYPSSLRQNRTWNVGDTYEIRKAYPCIDQPGRGQGDMLSGNPPRPTGWPNQAQEPIYTWGNTQAGSTSNAGARAPSPGAVHVKRNRDFYNQVEAFDGASGVGVGPAAARPATCTPRVAYWAADEKKLYQCTAPDSWALYYTELPYPYCVDGVGPGCPASPSP